MLKFMMFTSVKYGTKSKNNNIFDWLFLCLMSFYQPHLGVTYARLILMVCYVHIVKCSNDIIMFLNVGNATYVHDALFSKVAESSGH